MTSWAIGGSRKEKGGHESLFVKLKRLALSTDRGPKNTFITPAAMGVLSLPADTIKHIVSYLTVLDRFRLKMAGNHFLASLISTVPRPSFQTCLAQLAPLTSKCWHLNTGPEKALHVACEEGYDALVHKLLHSSPCLISLACLEKCLIAAIVCRQESVVRILLVRLPTDPYSEFLDKLRLRRFWYMTKTTVVETLLKEAAVRNCEWAIPLLLEHGARPSSRRGLQALSAAASYGHEEVVTMLSKRILWSRGSKLSDILTKAAQGGHEKTVKVLLDRGAEMPHDPSFPGAKHLAAKEGHENIFKLLVLKDPEDYFVNPRIHLDEGGNIYSSSAQLRSTQEDLRWCALHFAIYGRNYTIVKFLLEHDMVPPFHAQHRATALPLASKRGCTDIVKLLLETGFDVFAQLQGRSAVQLAARYGYAEIIALLLDAGAAVGSCDLLNAACSGSAAAVSLLLDKGADIQEKAYISEETALHVAVHHHHAEVVRVLLKSGAKTEVMNRYGYTPLAFAIGHSQEECINLLVEYGADIELVSLNWTGRRESALCCAIEYNKAHLIPLLLQYRANIEAKGYEGKRPFHRAAMQGNVAALEALLTSGANKNARDALQQTALHHASLEGATDAILALLRWGLDIHARDKHGQTPLHKAPLSPYTDSSTAYNLLVSHGADPEAKDNGGKSAASYLADRREAYYDRLTRGQ
ncbi:ankyrin repeat-containing domain protein [Aspergillus caelatus]|uniref:Ankyrin repeat-containing domain protein n=1 Tax=Aspergillus caelatus TaxID=61420 RepID=A0A5N7A0P1_9EURO|nr:ankyrin repeat-containing domain protein [Aspergillus caelatus]KAE8363431.1 ankyrin repeat-containing domain protein [Aspergillus caelatus]